MHFSLVTLAGLVPCILAAAVAPVASRELQSQQAFEVAAANFDFTKEFRPALEHTLNAFYSIPDEVLAEGADAANKWFVENDYREVGAALQADDDNAALSVRDLEVLDARGFVDVAKCVGSVLWAIGSTAIPIAKIGRIKSYINALGGVKKAVELMLGATSKAEKLKAGGQALVNLGAELLGIAGVKANCF
ncbi:hypothetical protein K4F52_002409 [Lecanicillium sp. MT-2017a]|nr:hypothetical protein K4F52_002409 [Lecanicillium sp. MT-2017a]